jgi:tetratricopeptide (TPR) repeat protein
LLSAGRLAEAEPLFLEAIAIEPDNDSARLEFARYLRRADRCLDAIEHYLQAETAASAAAGVVPSVVPVETALCLVRTGSDADARNHLEEWLQRRPNDAELQDALARVLAASPDDTVRDGHKALELATAAEAADLGVDALETLAMAHAELHDFEQAIEAQERAIALADEQDRDTWLIVLNSALENYQEGRPNRRPWPDFMFAP